MPEFSISRKRTKVYHIAKDETLMGGTEIRLVIDFFFFLKKKLFLFISLLHFIISVWRGSVGLFLFLIKDIGEKSL